MLAADFVTTRTGKYSNFPVSVDPAQAHQCVALFWDYNQAVNVAESYPGGNGADLWTIPWTSYTKIPASAAAQYGDWASWSGTTGAYPNGGAGHTAMWVGPNNTTSGYFFTQNPDPAAVVLLQYAGIQGYLRTETTPMTIAIDERFTAKNWTAQANVPATWGIGPRTVTSITIHWWGDPVGQTYAGIIDWFCNPKSAVQTSAHYVVSSGVAACIVSPWDAAWHAGNAYGNVHSIGIECDPKCSDEDYATIADVVRQIRATYGNIPLFPHNHWTQTTCPGDYRLDRIDALTATVNTQSTTVTPIGGFLMALTDAQQTEIYNRITRYLDSPVGTVPDKTVAAVMDEAVPRAKVGGLTSLRSTVSYLDTNLADIKAAVAVPATVTLDAAGVQAIADQLKTQLGPDVVQAIAAQWAKQ